MAALTFKQLVSQKPVLRTGTGTLPDGRKYQIHELPCLVLEDVARIAKAADAESEEDISMRDVAAVAAHALLGRKAKDDEISALMDTFGTAGIQHIYTDALKFSHLGEEALKTAKKD